MEFKGEILFIAIDLTYRIVHWTYWSWWNHPPLPPKMYSEWEDKRVLPWGRKALNKEERKKKRGGVCLTKDKTKMDARQEYQEDMESWVSGSREDGERVY